MDDDVKRNSIRFIQSLGRWADADLFEDDDAWDFMGELLSDFAEPSVRLSDGQLIALRNLGASLGMRPGLPLRGYGPALKRAFGPGPMNEAQLNSLTRYIYGQVNGGSDFEPAARPKVTLKVHAVGEKWGEPKKR